MDVGFPGDFPLNQPEKGTVGKWKSTQRPTAQLASCSSRRLHPDLSRRLSRENREALQFFEKTQAERLKELGISVVPSLKLLGFWV